MRTLITGCNGLLGQKLLQTLSTELYELHGIDLGERSLTGDVKHRYRRLDITDRKLTVAAIREIEPQVIIHTAAMTEVDRCELEKERCWNVNVKGTDDLISGAVKVGSRFIFISSDYVFDGSSGPYREEDRPNPINYYGRSKLAAENLLRGSGLDWTIARTIVLYGYGKEVRSSFLTWLLGMLRAGRTVRIVNDQWGNCTIVDDLALAIDRMVMLSRNGIYHVGGRDYMTRLDFARTAARLFDLDPELITPISTAELQQPARRPLQSGLEIEKGERELYISFRTVDEALELYRSQEASEETNEKRNLSRP